MFNISVQFQEQWLNDGHQLLEKMLNVTNHQIRSDQLLSRVRLFATPWIAARQASLSITNSWSSLRLTSIESVMPSSHLILCRPLLLQIKTIVSDHLTPVRMALIKNNQITNVGEDVEKREPLYTVGGNVNWYSYYGKQYRGFWKN